MKLELTWQDLLTLVPDALLEGEPLSFITGIAGLDEAGPSDLSFLGNPKYRASVPLTKAGVLLLPLDYVGSPSPGQAYLRVRNPSLVLATICQAIEARTASKPLPGIHPSAVIAPDARIAASATIGPFCVIEAGVTLAERTVLMSHVSVGQCTSIGADCVLFPRVTVYQGTQIGDRVRIHAGSVIGSDGFGYETSKGVHVKVPQIGCVIIEDDVEIGANTTIDRARFSETRIGAGTKIDNLVQIAHNVRIGRGCLLAAQVGISGSTTLGQYVMMGGQSALTGHIVLGNQVIVGGQSGVSKDTPDKALVAGSPAYPLKEHYKVEAYKRRLPELFARIQAIEAEVGIQNVKSTDVT
ncbi:MAG: UDP-3-O-(3-hydroxymyristoyl)glucosamine N-acyltransferase [Verrucomicrobiota bacterium]|nr:UDP-3-O-(3-hydroxymyristoyl)glucosamine N-acyltransferase [Verrucomicrobiota bacterium]